MLTSRLACTWARCVGADGSEVDVKAWINGAMLVSARRQRMWPATQPGQSGLGGGEGGAEEAVGDSLRVSCRCFYGGGSKEWAAPEDTTLLLSQFEVWRAEG